MCVMVVLSAVHVACLVEWLCVVMYLCGLVMLPFDGICVRALLCGPDSFVSWGVAV